MPESNADRQRRARERRKQRIAQMDKIPCACGCGETIAPFNANLQPNHYVKGHQTRMNPSPHAGKPAHNRIGDEPLTRAEITRRYREQRYAEIEQMDRIPCACGCGVLVLPFNKKLQPNQFEHGHNSKGVFNNNWNDGAARSPYGPGFTNKYKKLIRERDNYTCRRCGKTQKQEGRTLQIHHLDHDKNNNDPSNLVTACGSCNSWASRNRDKPFTT